MGLMCGIAGIVETQRRTPDGDLTRWATAMADRLVHRGPDAGGVWSRAEIGVALSHRRLSILDLTPTGAQPMFSFNGQKVIVFNGEIYNHSELRSELIAQGISFRGTSDTETLVNGCQVWGVAETVARCRGIFAFALCDIATGVVLLARDHVGVKPLYYGRSGTTWLFASELKAFSGFPGFQPELNRDVLPHYLRHNYVPGPYTVYEQVHKLPAGTVLTIDPQGADPQPVPYWSFTEIAWQGVQAPWSGSSTELADRLEQELARSVREQMLSDVPLGAFLSGGIDSSLVVALMQSQSRAPVKTFSIGFELKEYNEAPFARAVAQHLRTDHTEHYVTAREAQEVIPRLPELYDEPFADSSQIPTYLVCALARQQVTVALSGDGGDELFCGYLRYFAPLLGNRAGLLPTPIRWLGSQIATQLGRTLPAGRWRKFCQRSGHFLQDADPDARYLRGMTHWPLQTDLVLGADPPVTDFLDPHGWPQFPHRQQRWMWLDTRNYLPDDILVKVDRASMAVSLEARVPLLDPQVIAAAWRIPLPLQTRGWTGKRVLRNILARYVPKELFERPKKGFGVPIAEWLRGPLRSWAEDLLDPALIERQGVFAAAPIREKWNEHLSQRVDWAYLLWDVLMFQSWWLAQRPTAHNL
jgi:asparagine synthase (glutamine-hydrolysing)